MHTGGSMSGEKLVAGLRILDKIHPRAGHFVTEAPGDVYYDEEYDSNGEEDMDEDPGVWVEEGTLDEPIEEDVLHEIFAEHALNDSSAD
eukprot:12264276-Alexandrium_andersonii.AAC.1